MGSQSEQYVGYKSGKRSAILAYSGRVYRLKGKTPSYCQVVVTKMRDLWRKGRLHPMMSIMR